MRRSLTVVVTAVATIGVLLGTCTNAMADQKSNYGNIASVDQNTATGVGTAIVTWSNQEKNIVDSKNAQTYAYADILNDNSGFSLNGWLERSTNGGASWSVVSGIHSVPNGTYNDQQTDAYYDGPGYLARACFQFTSWSGAAVHCSPAI